MARATSSAVRHVIFPRRQWGCFVAVLLLLLAAAVVLAVAVWLVRPGRAVHPIHLIGEDVDGVVLIELNRSSRRVGRFVEELIRPLSYEVQSHPEKFEKEMSDLLDVMTFRYAVCLLRRDPFANREQWACVVPIKRLSDPMKVLVKQLAERPETRSVETLTSGGTLLFWSKQGSPYFAIAPRALLIANDREWLDEVSRRVAAPLAKTPRANRLYLGLPRGSKHCFARACVLISPERWYGLTTPTQTAVIPLAPLARLRRTLDQCGFEPRDLDLVAARATVEPRGRLRFDLEVRCDETTPSAALCRMLNERWPELSAAFQGAEVASVAEPTTTTTGILFSWKTPPVEKMLGLGPDGEPAAGFPTP